jgi:hypothetical protein
MAVKRDPRNPAGYVVRAAATLDMGGTEGVADDLDAAQSLDDNLHQALTRVRYLTQMGRHTEAVQVGTATLERWPGEPAERTLAAALAAANQGAAGLA